MHNDQIVKISDIEHQKQLLRLEFKETLSKIEKLQARLDQIKAQLEFADKFTIANKSNYRIKDWLEGYKIPNLTNSGVTEALKILAEQNESRSFTIAQLHDAMKRAGVVNSQSENFRQTLYVTANRLVADGFLGSSIDGKFKTFFLKQKTVL